MKPVGAIFLVLGWACSALAAGLPTAGATASTQPTLWSLTPLQKLPAPSSGEINPLDSFIRTKLKQRGLHPSETAAPTALLRRLCYDLTGLPPTPEELKLFRTNPSLESYQSFVERWLASPRYGEHWARHWLDVANYADTHGNDHDYIRPQAWRYRDYVIRSFNEDKPYARFVQEQVAGDALFPENPEATLALGFVAAGP